MKNIKRRHKKTTYLPRVCRNKIVDMMDASNISRMHLGLDPLPYLWYKKTVQLGRAGMMKFLDNEKSVIVLSYLSATRKQRREIPMFHKCYMTILSILRVKLKNENLDKEIKELNEKLEKLKKN